MIPFINGMAGPWFQYIVSATLQATLLALLILVLVRICHRWPPALRYALLMLALCKFVVPPMLSLPTGLFNHIHPPQWFQSAPRPSYVSPPAQNILGPAVETQRGNMRVSPESSSPPKPVITGNGRLLLLHLSGALLIIAVAALQRLRLRRLAFRVTLVQNHALAEAYDTLCRSMRLISKPRLLISRETHAPMAFGTFRPTVIIPQALVVMLPLSEIRVILGHELAHHRRRDPWIAWLQMIVSAIWWFNPVYWLLSRSIRGVREDCCDDMVLASGLVSREVYCRTLLNAARAALQNKAVVQAACAYLGKLRPLRRRFKRIMSIQYIRTPKLAKTGMMMIFSLAVVLLPGVEPGILAQNTIPAAANDRSINPAAQETASVLQNVDGSSKVESRTQEQSRERNQDRASLSQDNTISEYYRKWLDGDVVYIITAEERTRFLALKTDEEREFFIGQFWARRNPGPRSSNNSFKEEHYRRITYANEHFASGIPGWETDRGRIYIMFGKPDEIESHPKGTATTYPFEIWRYSQIDGLGADIEIEFVEKGEYKMAMSPDEKVLPDVVFTK